MRVGKPIYTLNRQAKLTFTKIEEKRGGREVLGARNELPREEGRRISL
jgi:hypothetical protein